MRKNIMFITAILLLIFVSSFDTSAQKVFSFNVGGATYEPWVSDKEFHMVLKTSLKFRISKYLEPGIELGYTNFNSVTFDPNVAYYALELNAYLTTLLFNKDNPKFDLYLSGKYGGYYIFFSEEFAKVFEKENRPDYGAYLGIQYMFSKHVGAYIEGGFGNINHFQAGLNFKF